MIYDERNTFTILHITGLSELWLALVFGSLRDLLGGAE